MELRRRCLCVRRRLPGGDMARHLNLALFARIRNKAKIGIGSKHRKAWILPGQFACPHTRATGAQTLPRPAIRCPHSARHEGSLRGAASVFTRRGSLSHIARENSDGDQQEKRAEGERPSGTSPV